MKIIDLLEVDIKKYDKVLKTQDYKIMRNPSYEKKGAGIDAYVFQHKKNPHEVIKIASIVDKRDATYQFIKMILEHQDNPHFPKIYDVRLYRSEPERKLHDKIVKYKMVIRMEKLVPLTIEKTRHLLPILLSQLGIDIDEMLAHVEGWYGVEISEDDIRQMHLTREQAGAMGSFLHETFVDPQKRKWLIENTKNEYLKEALILVDDLIRKNPNFNPDLHEENIMLRPLRSAPQIVITDPVSTQ